ncbi:MAG: hypothetical protein H0X39_00970 [Actinobacteria bacterium]|nr:hypothetical protein [Actinomycetota bacterium]
MINLIGRRTDTNGTPHIDVEAFLVTRADKSAIEDTCTLLHEGNIDQAKAALDNIGDERLFAFLQAHPDGVSFSEPSAAGSGFLTS